MRLLILDDNADIREALGLHLEALNCSVTLAGQTEEALSRLRSDGDFDAAFLDLELNGVSGLDLIPEFIRLQPNLKIVMLTGFASFETAVEAMRRGAFDYLPKPITLEHIRQILAKISEVIHLKSALRRTETLRGEAGELWFPETSSDAVTGILRGVKEAARSNAPILITGESGTGKTQLARWIHSQSSRAAKSFSIIACPDLPADLMESELFGHSKGAFTGAVRDAEGQIAATEGGTLFFDEIGELSISLQPKLLHFLQEKNYRRLGETWDRKADVRLIAATNRDLHEQMEKGLFREDLYYRLQVIEFCLPPLRERRSDIIPLAESFLKVLSRDNRKNYSGFSPAARDLLSGYSWPGNIRELRSAVERAVILAEGGSAGENANLDESDFAFLKIPRALRKILAPDPGDSQSPGVSDFTFASLEKRQIEKVLGESPSLEKAAELLGIDPSTLYRKRKKYGL